jgi:signal transduction histidine kinase
MDSFGLALRGETFSALIASLCGAFIYRPGLYLWVSQRVQKKQNQKLLALSKTAGEVATLEERRRIAQKLHDGLLQSLATHILRIETCHKLFSVRPQTLTGN